MFLQLEVIVSSTIRRKKPWPRIEWIGCEKESVFLLDHRRVSQLYLPSGKTKRANSAFKSFSGRVLCLNKSLSGEYVAGILQTGGLFVWHKDSDRLISIPGFPGFTYGSGKDSTKVNIFVSNDASTILLLLDYGKVYIWEQTTCASQLHYGASSVGSVPGQWSCVNAGNAVLSTGVSKEATLDAVFFTNEVHGKCCICSFVFNTGQNLSIGTLLLRWGPQSPSPHKVGFISSFSHATHALNKFHPPCQAVSIKGAYIARWTSDGQTLAVAMNQKQPIQTRLLFIHPWTDSLLNVGLGNLGNVADKVLTRLAKSYWIADMSWTYDNVFLACITRRGSMLMLSRLGEMIKLSTHGVGSEFGPSTLLPLHPLVEFDGPKGIRQSEKIRNQFTPTQNDDISIQSSTASEKILKQKFSVATHPRLPVIVCSDGYAVTALRTADVIHPYDFATMSLVESIQKLQKIIQMHQLQVTISRPLHFLLPRETAGTARFKDHRWTVLFNNIKNRIMGKNKRKQIGGEKPLSAIDNANTNKQAEPLRSNLKRTAETEDDTPFTYMFEELAEEMKENDENSQVAVNENDDFSFDVDSPLGTKDYRKSSKTPAGLIYGADEGKISFGDMGNITSMHAESLNVEQGSDKEAFDGVTLLKELARCRSSILFAMALILTTRSKSSTRTRSKSMKVSNEKNLENLPGDELVNFFMSTVKLYCEVLLQLQDVAEILHFNPDVSMLNYLNQHMTLFTEHAVDPYNGHMYQRSLRAILCDEAYILGHCILILMSWDATSHSQLPLISKVVGQVICTVHQCSRRASEGCLSPDDLLENTFRSFLLLARSEKYLQKIYSPRPTILNDEAVLSNMAIDTDQFHFCDVGNNKEGNTVRLFLVAAWRKFLKHIALVLDLKQEIPDFKPLLASILSYAQLHSMDKVSVVQRKIQEVTHTNAVNEMSRHLSNYKLDTALLSAHLKLNIQISNIMQSAVEDWVPAELLSSVMVSYFTNGKIPLPCFQTCMSAGYVVPLSALRHKKVAAGMCASDRSFSNFLQRDVITKSVKIQEMNELWNINHTMMLLLSCGRVREASRVSFLVSDWRTAVVLNAVADKIHFAPKQKSVPLHKDFIEVVIKDSIDVTDVKMKGTLKVMDLLKVRFKEILSTICGSDSSNDKQNVTVCDVDPFAFTEMFSDLHTVAVMTGVTLTAWSFGHLLTSIKSKIYGDISLLVPSNFYLPAPPIYLPQLLEDVSKCLVGHLENKTHLEAEIRLRSEVSLLMRILMASCHSARISYVISSWYTRWLERESTRERSRRPGSQTEDVESLSNTLSDIKTIFTQTDVFAQTSVSSLVRELELDFQHRSPEVGEEEYLIGSIFREMCAMLWMLHVRDRLSLALRNCQQARENLLNAKNHREETKEDNLNTESSSPSTSPSRMHEAAVKECLMWVDRMWPFATFLQAEADLQDLVLCLVLDLPMNLETGPILAKYFHDKDLVSPRVEPRFKLALQQMRQIGIPVETWSDDESGAASTMQPLSIFFNEKCRKKNEEAARRKKKGKMMLDHSYVFVSYQVTTKRMHNMDPESLKSGSFQDSMLLSDGMLDSISSSRYQMTQTNSKNLLKALGDHYAFESDPVYHVFFREFLDIFLNMVPSNAVAHGRSPSKKYNSRNRHDAAPTQLPLFLSYRNEIAAFELEKVTHAKDKEATASLMSGSLLRDVETPPSNRHHPPHSSTPKSALRKSHSASDIYPARISKSKVPKVFKAYAPAFSLQKYFSQSDISTMAESHKASEIPKISRVNLADLPPRLCKRLVRLVPFFSWLEHWNHRSIMMPRIHRLAKDSCPALRVNLTSDLLMHGFTISELRFNKTLLKKPAFKTKVESEPQLREMSTIPNGEFERAIVKVEDTLPKEVVDEENAGDVEESAQDSVKPLPKLDVEPVEQETKLLISANEEESDVHVVEEQEKSEPSPSAGMGCSKDTIGADNKENTQEMQPTIMESQKHPDGLPIDVVQDMPFSDVASTGLQSDMMPDGGGRMKASHPPPPHASKREQRQADVSSVVREEINNVLLGQQVSLLSQILFGQALPGVAQRSAELFNTIQTLRNVTTLPGEGTSHPPSSLQDDHRNKSPDHVQQHVDSRPLRREHLDIQPPRPVTSMNRKFGIPLFHIPGINKSMEPKPTPLVHTPESRRAWAASQEMNNRNSPMHAASSGFTKLLRFSDGGYQPPSSPVRQQPRNMQHQPRQDKGSSYRPVRRNLNEQDGYYQVQREAEKEVKPTPLPKHNFEEYQEPPDIIREYETPRDPPHPRHHQPDARPSQVRLPLLGVHDQASQGHVYQERHPGPTGRGIYKTKYPILNSPTPANLGPPSFPRAKPAWTGPRTERPRPQFQWNVNTHYGGILEPEVKTGVALRLVDPREILAYESQKRGSTSHGFLKIKSKSDHPPARVMPAVPIMKVRAPSFEEIHLPPTEIPPKARQQEKHVNFVDPPTMNAQDQASSSCHSDADKAEDEEIDGVFSQDEIKQEFEAAAAMHYLASVGKEQIKNKARMKETGQQTEVVEEEKVQPTVDYHDKLTTEPIKHLPPPDIYLKLRFGMESGLPLENVADDDMKDRFINVGGVDASSVLGGISKKEEEESSSAELHYKASRVQRSSQVPGYHGDSDWESANSMLSKQIKEATKVSQIRDSTKNRWSSAMKQMSSQLDAIDAMSQNMQQDFKSSERLVKTIDTLTDLMVPSVEDASRKESGKPRKKSLSPVSELSSEHSPRSPRLSQRSHIAPQPDTYHEVTPYHPSPYEREDRSLQPARLVESREQPERSHEFDRYRGRLNEALQLAGNTQGGRGIIAGMDDPGQLRQPSLEEIGRSSLGSSVMSLEQDGSVTGSRQRVMQYVASPSQNSLQDSVFSLQDELDDLLQDTSPKQERMKPWRDRTDGEKESIRRWMANKRKDRTRKYKEHIQRLRESEKKPFQPSKEDSFRSKRDKATKREIEASNVDTRIEQAMVLLEDLKSDRLYLPTQDVSNFQRTNTKNLSSTPKQRPSQRKAFTARSGGPTGPYYGANRLNTGTGIQRTNVGMKQHNVPSKKIPFVKDRRGQGNAEASKRGHAGEISLAGSDHLSDISGLSGWSMSDEVKALLYSTDSSRKPPKGVTFDLGGRNVYGRYTGGTYSPLNSGQVLDNAIDDRASSLTESLLGDIDWREVERMVASVDSSLT